MDGKENDKFAPTCGDVRTDFGFFELLSYLAMRDVYPVQWHEHDVASNFRGLIEYLKDIIERLLAILLIAWFCTQMIGFLIAMKENIPFEAIAAHFVPRILKFLSLALIIDTALLIADLIDSPGIREVRSILISTVSAYLLLRLSDSSLLAFGNTAGYSLLIASVCATVALLILTNPLSEYIHALADAKRKQNRTANN